MQLMRNLLDTLENRNGTLGSSNKANKGDTNAPTLQWLDIEAPSRDK